MKLPLSLLILVTGQVFSAGAAPLFRNPQPVPMPSGTVSELLAADFNGDGFQDAVVISPSESVTVMLADGAGPFLRPVVTPMAFQTGPPAIGDVNRDGRNDLIVSDWGSGTAAVLLGNGDGTFTPGATFPTGAIPGPLALADFNGDHLLDVAIGSEDSHSTGNPLSVHFGDGSGQFSAPVTTSAGSPIQRLEAGDVNGDGKADLVTGGFWGVRIFLGNGNGTFSQKSYAAAGGLLLADFNHDGKLDLAVAAGGTHDGYVDVALGTGDGSMIRSALYACGYDGDFIDGADLDDDGNLDLLIASTMGSTVAVLRGNADGTFDEPEFFLSGNSTWQVVVSDFDRDGHEDFLTLDYNSEIRSLSFVRGNAGGAFQTYRAFHTNPSVPTLWPGLAASDGTVADANNDGHPDVILAQHHSSPSGPDDLVTMLNDGTGKLGRPIKTATSAGSWPSNPDIAVADVNHDGKVDVVTASPQGKTFLGNGDGTFASPISLTLTAAGRATLGHFNGDTNLDLFVSGGYESHVYPGNGDGTFGADIRSAGNTVRVFVGDLNGDGKADYVSSSIRDPQAFINDGNGHFTPISISNQEMEVLALADFNKDAKLDLLFETYTAIETRFGNGDGTFAAPLPFIMRVADYHDEPSIVTADFDGDGHLDLAAGTSIYLGNGDGTFRSRSRFRTNRVTAADTADMDGNGSLDLVVTKAQADDVDVLLSRTAAEPTESVSITLTADKVASEYAQYVTFTAMVTGPRILPTGVVLFEVDGGSRALIPVDVDGKAQFSAPFAIGSYAVTATYSGDEYYTTTTSNSVDLAVTKARTTMFVSGSPNPQAAGRSVSIHAYRSAFAISGFAGPTGPITLRDGDTVLGEVASDGRLTISTLGIGSHTITASYAGDANYEPSSASYVQVITKRVPNLSVQTTPAPAALFAGQTVTIQASFPGSSGVTGTVSFYVDDVLRATVPVAQAAASHQTSFTWGTHVLRAEYSGDASWAGASQTLNLTVYAGQWGTPLQINASCSPIGSLTISWSPIEAATSYTLWRKTSLNSAWTVVQSFGAATSATSMGIPANTTWLFAVTAKHYNGSVSPMSAPDLATSVRYTDGAITAGMRLRAHHFSELRTAVASVRTFAGLGAFSYANPIAPRQRVRAADLTEIRTALAQARAAIGVPALSLTDGVLTPRGTRVRAVHLMELRAGAN